MLGDRLTVPDLAVGDWPKVTPCLPPLRSTTPSPDFPPGAVSCYRPRPRRWTETRSSLHYAAAGVEWVWLVDTEARKLEVHQVKDGAATLVDVIEGDVRRAIPPSNRPSTRAGGGWPPRSRSPTGPKAPARCSRARTTPLAKTPLSSAHGRGGCTPHAIAHPREAFCGGGSATALVEPGESCDPKRTCPRNCRDNDPCTTDILVGNFKTCDARCVFEPIACGAADGCCAETCDGNTDPDCPATCGNGEIEAGETCDPPESCPTSCVDTDPCTSDAMIGSPETCDAFCPHTAVRTCQAGDQCCPVGCDHTTDGDCPDDCGPDCVTGDGCCPAGCDNSVDLDCPECGATCVDNDGCCGAGCDFLSDSDCPLDCRDDSTWPAAWAEREEEVLFWTNVARGEARSCDAEFFEATGDLVMQPQLREAARCHTLDQAVNDFLDHVGSNGSSLADRVDATGYFWYLLGENVAAGYDTAESVVQGWIDSPGHCVNLMEPLFTELGVGFAINPNTQYGTWWTQNFGRSTPP